MAGDIPVSGLSGVGTEGAGGQKKARSRSHKSHHCHQREYRIKIEPSPSAGSVLHPVSFGKILQSVNVKDIVNDNVKSNGKDFIALSLLNPTAVNAFLCNPLLALKCLKGFIPSFNVTRLSLVRSVPSDWSPWIGEKKKFSVVLWFRRVRVSLRDDRSDRYGSAAVLIRNHIPFSPVGNPDDAAAYRPIALFSVLAKNAEHWVKNRLEWIAGSRGLLANSQYGFKKGRSTTDSLSVFISDIRVSFFKGKSVTAAFLDVSSAYDNEQLPIPRKKLKMRMRLRNFIINLHSERKILLRIGSEVKASRLVWRRLPQRIRTEPIFI
ncbi:Probable RNA-directed DNA polymerase from transposon X-element [Eumeta japonica]|uniref:Probable RNA-directed DNA polymerase from transposon X-element n=1 Tax=Eumeta variegata TaxID=151549 RepID=A0A4C1Z711_EUMVA|nr:Probable RNA-directed DNA polymerase from transposon X-element [Eumeta japonica]